MRGNVLILCCFLGELYCGRPIFKGLLRVRRREGATLEQCLLRQLKVLPHNPGEVLHIQLPPRRGFTLRMDLLQSFSLGLHGTWSVTVSDGCVTNAHPKIAAYVIFIQDLDNLDGDPINKQLGYLRCETFTWNPYAKFLLIILTQHHSSHYRRIALSAFNSLWKNVVYNGGVMVSDREERGVSLYRADPLLRSGDCGKNIRPDQVEKVREGCRGDVFPVLDKIRFSGCEVLVSQRTYQPFSFIEEGRLVGLDVEIVKLAVEKTGIVINWIERASPDSGFPVNIVSQYFDNLSRNEIDIAIGGPTVLTRLYFGLSYTHSTASQYLVVYAANAEAIPRWKTLFVMFTPEVWLVVFTTFIVSVVLLYAYGEWVPYSDSGCGKAFLVVFAVLLEKAVGIPKSSSVRVAFASLIIYSYAVSSLYTALLHKFTLKRPISPEIRTVQDVLDLNLSVSYTETMGKILVLVTLPLGKRVLQNHRSSGSVNESLRELLKFRDHVLLERDTSMNFLKHKYNVEIHSVGEPLGKMDSSLVLPKGSLYFEFIDSLVVYCTEHGLKTKWMNDLIGKDLNEAKPTEDSPQVLTLTHLQIIFSLLALGHILALIVLIIELSLGRYFRHKKLKEKEKMTSQMFLGERLKAKKIMILRLD